MRDRIWYTLVDTKTKEFYTVSVTKFYQVCDWVIVGGESSRRPRTMDPVWVIDIHGSVKLLG